MMDSKKVAGYWELKSIRTRIEDGTWLVEKVIGGGLTLTPSHQACLFIQTSEGPFAYAGSYEVDDHHLAIRINAGITPELVNTVSQRDLKFLTENEMELSGTEFHTGRYFEAIYARDSRAFHN